MLMKKRLFFMSMLFITVFGFAQTSVIWSDNFDDESISDWTLYDHDGDGHNWETVNLGSGYSPAIASYSYDNPTYTPLSPDNYIVSPAINLSGVTGQVFLKYKVKSQDPSYPNETYSVYAATEKSLNTFLAATPLLTENAATNGTGGVFYEKTIDLSAFAGQSQVYIAFRHHDSYDNFSIHIDDVSVSVPLEYCTIASTNVNYEYITNVKFGGVENPTEGVAGYNDFTSIAGTVYKNRTGENPLSVTINADSGDNVSAFIDWNQNGILGDVDNEIYTLATDTDEDGPYTIDITPPADAAIGQTRMRVIVRFYSTPNACTSFTYGEIEDYTVNIKTPAPYCPTVTLPADGATDVDFIDGTEFSWTPDPSDTVTGYDFYLDETDGSTLLGSTTLTDVLITGLDPKTTYYWKVVAKNETGSSEGCTVYSFTTTAAPSEPYCYATSSSFSYEYITNVNFAGIDNETTSEAGYNLYTDQVGVIKKGETLPLSVTINADANDYVSAYIDWNHNNILDDEGEVYTLATKTSNNGPFTLNITPPEGAELGETRMRIIVRWNAEPSPCTSFNFGEVEDYTVKVEEALAVSDASKSKISIYPNPFVDVVNITDINNVKSIEVTDAAGRLVQSLKPQSQINLSGLNSGVYIITLKMKDGSKKNIKAIKK